MNPWNEKTPKNCLRVKVTWRDIRDVSSWTEDEEVRCCRHLESTGWLLHDGADPGDPGYEILVIAATYDWEDERWADFTVFPKTVIKEII